MPAAHAPVSATSEDADGDQPDLPAVEPPSPSPARQSWRGRIEGHVVGAVSLALALGLLWLLWMLSRPIGLLLAAVILANALEPLVDWLNRWMRRSFAITLIYLALFGLAAGAIGLVVPLISRQVSNLADDLPTLIERAQGLIAQWGPMVQSLGASSAESATGGPSTLARVPLLVASSVLEVVLVIFLSLYWLIAMPTLRGFFLSLLRPDQIEKSRAVLGEIGQTMGGYVRGVLLESLLVGALVFLGTWLLGLRYPMLLAALAMLGEVVPYVGPVLAAAPAILLALFESPTQALIVMGLYLVLQIVEGYVLFPFVVGSQSDIPPLLIIVGLLAGGTIGGVLGALVAIPVAGALQVIVLRVVAPALRRETGGRAHLVEHEARVAEAAG